MEKLKKLEKFLRSVGAQALRGVSLRSELKTLPLSSEALKSAARLLSLTSLTSLTPLTPTPILETKTDIVIFPNTNYSNYTNYLCSHYSRDSLDSCSNSKTRTAETPFGISADIDLWSKSLTLGN